jgi:hypothetical protein
MSNNADAHFVGILGTTGCGKTTELKRQLARLPARNTRRTIIWSPKEIHDRYADLYPGSVTLRSVAEVLAKVKAAGKSNGFHIVFVPTLDQKRDMAMFDVLCKIALAAGNLTFIVEELHTATLASNAVHGWRKVNFMGRASGVYVFGLSQRPASVDKAFLGSLSFLHVGRLPYPADQKAAAEALGVPREEVAALTGYQAIQRDFLTGKLKRP